MDNKQILMARCAKVLAELIQELQDPQNGERDKLITHSRTLIRELRAHTEDVAALITACAAKGMGKEETAESLGLSRYRFRLIADLLDIKWVKASETAGRKAFLQGLMDKPKSPASQQRQINLDRGRETFVEKMRAHNICGVQGTVKELYALWKDYCEVTYSCVNRRLQEGWTIYEAMFTKKRPSAVDRCRRTNKHREHIKRMNAAYYPPRKATSEARP